MNSTRAGWWRLIGGLGLILLMRTASAQALSDAPNHLNI